LSSLWGEVESEMRTAISSTGVDYARFAIHAAPLHSCRYRRLHARATIFIPNTGCYMASFSFARRQRVPLKSGRVEAKRGGVQARRRRRRTAPFRARSRREGHHSVSPSPLIEPDVTISVIRLSDGFHAMACAAADARESAATGHPVPQTPVAWETADSQTRRSCVGGGESDGRCGRGVAPHRAALS
jgi:hypothetical protein